MSHDEDPKLVAARAALDRLESETQAIAARVTGGDENARSELNAAIRRRDAAALTVRQLNEEDRRARGIPAPPAPMYGPPAVRSASEPRGTSGRGGLSGFLDRLLGRK